MTIAARPMSDRLIVRRIAPQEQTAGGLVIPEEARRKRQEGVVVAVGPGRFDDLGKRVPPTVTVGDHVLFPPFSGTELEIEGELLTILREDDVFVVLGARPT